MRSIYRIFRITINSFAMVLMLLVAFFIWGYSPLYSVLFFLSALDQFEDVYYYVYRKRLVPLWMLPFDVMFEVVLAGIGIAIFVFSLLYYAYFQTWFFRVMIPLSLMIVYSAIEDIVVWVRTIRAEGGFAPSMVSHHVCPKEEVCVQEGRFVRRK